MAASIGVNALPVQAVNVSQESADVMQVADAAAVWQEYNVPPLPQSDSALGGLLGSLFTVELGAVIEKYSELPGLQEPDTALSADINAGEFSLDADLYAMQAPIQWPRPLAQAIAGETPLLNVEQAAISVNMLGSEQVRSPLQAGVLHIDQSETNLLVFDERRFLLEGGKISTKPSEVLGSEQVQPLLGGGKPLANPLEVGFLSSEQAQLELQLRKPVAPSLDEGLLGSEKLQPLLHRDKPLTNPFEIGLWSSEKVQPLLQGRGAHSKHFDASVSPRGVLGVEGDFTAPTMLRSSHSTSTVVGLADQKSLSSVDFEAMPIGIQPPKSWADRAISSAQVPSAFIETAAIPVQKGTQALVQALAQRIQVQQVQGMDVATVRLDPPQMGSLEIRIRQDALGVQVQMHASHHEVARQLAGVAESLRQELLLRSSDASVTVASSRFSQSSSQQGSQQHTSPSHVPEPEIGQALQVWDNDSLT